MELKTESIGRGSVLERADPAKLPRPSIMVVLHDQEGHEEDPVRKSLRLFADAGDEAAAAIKNLTRRMNESLPPVRSFTAIGMSDYPDNEQSVVSVSCSARQAIGTKENDIYVKEIVKLAGDAYMECGDHDDDDELSLYSWMNKSVIPVGNVQGISEIDKDNEIDVEAIVKSAVDAYMECEDNDDDFVTPLLRKSEAKWETK
ncbi:hypothetical protein AAHA92_09656 [Salvia divinorum]|uniref:Uncharacterized protein n=1 Tax=Salvia divinorum TaxID=28513 RepID=A0ABD1HVN9_SALDI